MPDAVDPSRKRKIRLGVALSVAVLLAVALVYVSFNAASKTAEPSQILSASTGEHFEMNAKVVPGSIKHHGETIDFEVKDREGNQETMPVSYTGSVPDPFRGGREIILSGERESDGTFVGEPESLITKCPSKFTTNASETASSESAGSNG
ncbi:MAG: cytochrome c maturation protein CcmE [Solirubrobacterales bacterium]